MADLDLTAALLRGAVTSVAVAGMLLAARRWGRSLAGLLTGLPTVTGPAIVWLALDRGGDFAAQAAHGAVLAAAPCALFALVYAWLAGVHGRAVALTAAAGVSLLPVPLLMLVPWPMVGCVVLGAVASTVCLRLMPRWRRRAVPLPAPSAAMHAAAWTVLVAAAVSALSSLLAPALGPLWAGALTSPPLLAAAVVWEVHRQGCAARVLDFLRGYTAGLLGRTLFVAVFGVLLAPHGLAVALAASLGLALVLGWATHVWMHWRSSLDIIRP
jgi:hypothetical protein